MSTLRRRAETALSRLLDGRSCSHRGVNLWLAPDGYLEVRVHPGWRAEKTGEERTLDDRSFARRIVEEMSAAHPGFAALVEGRPWRFVTVREHGWGSTSIYHLDDGRLVWSVGLI